MTIKVEELNNSVNNNLNPQPIQRSYFEILLLKVLIHDIGKAYFASIIFKLFIYNFNEKFNDFNTKVNEFK